MAQAVQDEGGSTGGGISAGHGYRMIAIDLDGTLLSPTGHVTPRVKQAVHQVLQAGLQVCFATGRNWTESRAIIQAVGHHDLAVFVGGAMVIDTRRGVTLHRTMMHPQLARDVCGVLESAGHAVCALQDTGTAGVDYLVTGDAVLNDATRQWMTVTDAVVHRVPRLAGHPHEHTVRVGIVAAKDAVASARQGLLHRFGNGIICHNLFVPAYDVEVMEVFDPAVNKWQGVLHVARHHGIEPAHIVAVGDDVNDIPMLANAALGVAMGNARPPVRAAAGRVIGSNGEEGLAEFLEELVETRVRPTDVPEGTGR